MPAEFLIDDPDPGKVTVLFKWWAEITKAHNVVIAAAKILWSRGFGESDGDLDNFTPLTNNQKLNYLAKYILQVILDLAENRVHRDYDTQARDDAETDWNTNYSLGDE